jgi:DNA-binding winged helix-turn-helix (wHTH) protein
MLLDHPGEVVLREEIRMRLWPNNTVVEFDHGIKAAIQKLRDELGEPADRPKYVETVARRGYRSIGAVEKEAAVGLTDENVCPASGLQLDLQPDLRWGRRFRLPTRRRAWPLTHR